MDVVWVFVSFVLTLLVFSYIFGDNPLFRVATYLFVGVTAGYVALIAFEQVLWPQLIIPLLKGSWLALIPLGLTGLLLLKVYPPLARYGSLPMAFLVGVAAAVAIGGAVFGTMIGQVQGAANDFAIPAASDPQGSVMRLVEGGILLLGTVTTLIYFQFGARLIPGGAAGRPVVVETLAKIGQLFIAVTLGALFAGVFMAALTALIERLDFLRDVVVQFMIR
jgi:hypothetical protein